MLSITADMKEKQGLDGSKWYEAIVIENDDRKHPDKMMLGRIQARIKTVFDGIKDADLPWAVPIYEHPDGASEISGTFSVPKKRTKVFLRFQDANPSYPCYRGYHVDKVTQMEEIKHNYPNRTVTRFSNKALMIVDTQDNTLYLRNPGNVKIYVEGNVELEVKGNVDELIRGSVRRTIMGNYHDTVLGKREILTGLGKTETTLGPTHMFSTGGSTLESSGGEIHIEATVIHENSGKALGRPEAPVKAKMSTWPGIPGGAPGTNKRSNSGSNPEGKNATSKVGPTSGSAAIRTTTPNIEEHMPKLSTTTPCPGIGTPCPALTPATGLSTQPAEVDDCPGAIKKLGTGGGNRQPEIAQIIPEPLPG